MNPSITGNFCHAHHIALNAVVAGQVKHKDLFSEAVRTCGS
jgi:hypothetical protein